MPHPALQLNDSQLLAECALRTVRGSGPGGQKRNRTESAVRIRHIPTGVTAIAEESRSQAENRARALRRLREAIALRVRCPICTDPFTRPQQFVGSPDRTAWLRVTRRNPDYPMILATVLDVLDAHRGRIALTASLLGVSTSRLNRFLAQHPKTWEQANQIRRAHGQRTLTKL